MIQISLFGVSINIIEHVFFVFAQKFFCGDLWRFDFFLLNRGFTLENANWPIFYVFVPRFYVLRLFLKVIKCSFILNIIFFIKYLLTIKIWELDGIRKYFYWFFRFIFEFLGQNFRRMQKFEKSQKTKK
jgi:hypothetical protein